MKRDYKAEVEILKYQIDILEIDLAKVKRDERRIKAEDE